MLLDDEVANFYTALNTYLHQNPDSNTKLALINGFERVRRILTNLKNVGQVLHYPHAFMTKMQWEYYNSLNNVDRHRLDEIFSNINPSNEKLLLGTMQSHGFPVDLNEDSSLYLALSDIVSKIDTNKSKFLLVSMKKVIASFSSFGQSPKTQSVVEEDDRLLIETQIYDTIDDRVAKSMNAVMSGQNAPDDEHVILTLTYFIKIDLILSIITAKTFKDLKKKIQAIPDVLKQYRNTSLETIERSKRSQQFERIHLVICQTLLSELRDLVASTMYNEALRVTTYRGIIARKLLGFHTLS